MCRSLIGGGIDNETLACCFAPRRDLCVVRNGGNCIAAVSDVSCKHVRSICCDDSIVSAALLYLLLYCICCSIVSADII